MLVHSYGRLKHVEDALKKRSPYIPTPDFSCVNVSESERYIQKRETTIITLKPILDVSTIRVRIQRKIIFIVLNNNFTHYVFLYIFHICLHSDSLNIFCIIQRIKL